MKNFLLAGLLFPLLMGCASYQGGASDESLTGRDTIRERGTTGMGVGSDTTTQTGIDTGTHSGSGLPPH